MHFVPAHGSSPPSLNQTTTQVLDKSDPGTSDRHAFATYAFCLLRPNRLRYTPHHGLYFSTQTTHPPTYPPTHLTHVYTLLAHPQSMLVCASCAFGGYAELYKYPCCVTLQMFSPIKMRRFYACLLLLCKIPCNPGLNKCFVNHDVAPAANRKR